MTDGYLAVGVLLLFVGAASIGAQLADWIPRHKWLFVAQVLATLAIACILANPHLAPAPTPRAVDEPEPWPTETPYTCGDLKPWIDVLLNLNEQQLHYLEGMSMTPTPAPTLSATAPIPGATPTPTTVLCKRCEYESECGEGYKCYRCSDGLGRCVRREMPNGDCQNCVNAGLP